MDGLSHEQISQYLADHPELLARINVPHPYSGQAISIGERQVMLLRERVRTLENKLKEFVQFAEENNDIGEKMHRLTLDLMRAGSLPAALESLYLDLAEQFAVPHVALRLWGVAHEMAEFAPASQDVHALASGLAQPRCGGDAPDEVRAWFGEGGAHLRSFALVPLRDDRIDGLLVLASEDAQRFYPEMGTLYLGRLGELAAAAIARFL